MSTIFQLEERYFVVKRKHLSEDQENRLLQVLHDEEIPTVECLVLEPHWPEHANALNSIKARVEADEVD